MHIKGRNGSERAYVYVAFIETSSTSDNYLHQYKRRYLNLCLIQSIIAIIKFYFASCFPASNIYYCRTSNASAYDIPCLPHPLAFTYFPVR